MSALSLFDFGPSGLSRPRINFPNFLFENMERSFRSMKSELSFSPNTEVKRDGENLELAIELPGLEPEDIDVQLEDGRLIVSGTRTKEENSDSYSEFSYGRFSRSIGVSPEVNEDQVTASYEAGVLKVRVENAFKTAERSKSIPISIAAKENPKELEEEKKEDEPSGQSTGKTVE